MHKLITLGLLSFLFVFNVTAAEKPRGEIIGGVAHAAPGWFKESFLEIADDVDEASEEGKHVMLFFQLNGCPYCDRMLTEAFESDPLMSYMQKHFDVIGVNVKGDRDIAFNEEVSVTEKELSEMLKVRATPAILFLNADNKPVVRVDGYRAPNRFKHVLSFVAEKYYEQQKLTSYLAQKLTEDVYALRDHALFTSVTDLSSIKGPLAVFIEDKSCYDCDEMHDRMLTRDDIQEQLKAYTVVRLDADNKQTIVTPDGQSTTAKAWADSLEMIYRPGVLLFDNGKLIRRHDSLLFSHHFKESLRYVGGGHHTKEDYRTYSERRTEALLAAGETINLGD